MPEPDARTGRLRLALVIAGVVLLVVAGLLFLNRKTLAREALTGWLRSKGVPAQAQVTAFGPSRFRATLRVGDGKAPDFSAADVDVRYRLKGLGIEVQSVTLTRPVLRASLTGPGEVWLQSMPIMNLAEAVAHYLPHGDGDPGAGRVAAGVAGVGLLGGILGSVLSDD